MDFEKFKANRNKSAETLKQELESLDNKKKFLNEEDQYPYWNPQLDKAGLCLAEIRFLPSIVDGGKNLVKFESWGVKGPTTGKWYINNSLRNLGQDDPAQRYANIEWTRAKNAGLDRPKDSPLQKNKWYIANIYIISDKNNPENDGQVKLWKFGEKVYQKIKKKMFPEFEDDARINIFDLWEGANFRVKLSLKKVDKREYRDYDACEFASPSEFLNGDESKLQKVLELTTPVEEFLKPEKYKSYDELAKRLAEVLDIDVALLYDKHTVSDEDKKKSSKEFIKDDIPEFEAKAPKEVGAKESPPWDETPTPGSDDDDDFFKSLSDD